jgi:serine/threonine protein kinase
MRNSSSLSAKSLEGAKIIEFDPRGLKVLKLANGNILKLFRLRNQWSIARWYGYAQRFCANAKRLHHLHIPTVNVVDTYLLADDDIFKALPAPIVFKPKKNNAQTYAVEYMPLPGKTLKELLMSEELSTAHIAQLGAFIARLHSSGVHFRSLHLGNIVLTPEEEMGLIDVADMRIYPWALWFNTRLRSFRHVTRYAKLNEQFGQKNWQLLTDAYIQQAKLSSKQALVFQKTMKTFLDNPPH